MSMRVEPTVQELALDVGVPVVLYLVICSSRQASSNERPPSIKEGDDEKKQHRKKMTHDLRK